MHAQQPIARPCWPRAFCTIGALVLIGMVAVPGMPVWALDDEAARETLKGLPGVVVWVGDIAPDIAQRGVTKQQVQTEVERQLRRAEIAVFSNQEAGAPSDVAVVTVSVTTLRHTGGLYAYAVDLAVYQTATLLRDPTPRSLATWTVGSLSLVEASDLRAISHVREPEGRPIHPGLSGGESARPPGGRAARRGTRPPAPGPRTVTGCRLCAWSTGWTAWSANACGAPSLSTAQRVAGHGHPRSRRP